MVYAVNSVLTTATLRNSVLKNKQNSVESEDQRAVPPHGSHIELRQSGLVAGTPVGHLTSSALNGLLPPMCWNYKHSNRIQPNVLF